MTKGLVRHKKHMEPFPKFRHKIPQMPQVQVLSCASDLSEVPMAYSLDLMNLLECLTELREPLRFTSLLKDADE